MLELQNNLLESKAHSIGSNLFFISEENYDCRLIAFTQEHIIKMVFSFMEIQSLKDCRHVCRRWKDVGAAAISERVQIILRVSSYCSSLIPRESLKREDFEVTVGQDVLPNKNKKTTNFQKGPKTLESLVNLMNSSSYFPCGKLGINTCFFTHPWIQNQLSLMGSHLTTLDLAIMMYSTGDVLHAEINKTIKCLEKFLSEKAIHLENFVIHIGPMADIHLALIYWDSNPKNVFFKMKLLLHKLISFLITGFFSTKAFIDIIDSAINLRCLALVPRVWRFRHYQFANYLEYFMENQNLHKISLISHLNFYINNETLTGFEKFVNHKYVLERLKLKYFGLVDLECSPTVNGPHPRIGRLIELFLALSSNTLRIFTIVPLQHFGRIQIPILCKLKSIVFDDLSHLAHVSRSNIRIFPREFCAKKSFPILNTVVVGYELAKEETFFRKRKRKSVKSKAVISETHFIVLNDLTLQ